MTLLHPVLAVLQVGHFCNVNVTTGQCVDSERDNGYIMPASEYQEVYQVFLIGTCLQFQVCCIQSNSLLATKAIFNKSNHQHSQSHSATFWSYFEEGLVSQGMTQEKEQMIFFGP